MQSQSCYIQVPPVKTFPHGEGGSTCADGRGIKRKIFRRLSWFLSRHFPPQSLFRRHPSAPSPLGRFLGAPKDECTTKTTQLPTSHHDGYSINVTNSPQSEQYNRVRGSSAKWGPAKAQRSGFGGERRSSGATELLPLKAKRRMWSLRRRGVSFSSIFLHEKKDRVPEGRKISREPSKTAKRKNRTHRLRCVHCLSLMY